MAVSIGGGSPSGKPAVGGAGFLKTGKDAQALFQQEQAKAEAAKEASGKLWRFFIRKEDCGKDFKITFLDGHLDADGVLTAPMWMEHTVFVAGQWRNVPCTAHEEPCPICAKGDNAPALVAGFTIIDHTPYTIKKGANAGQTVKDQRRLYVPKKTTFGQLQKYATKHGGLAGLTFEVSRMNDKSPNVGDAFMVDEKRTLAQLAAIYGDNAKPADYGEEIVYYTASQLISMGAGQGSLSKIGGEINSKDLDAELGLG